VVILVGSEGAPYREALAGFAEELERAIPDQLTETLRPSASANFGAAQEARVRELSPALVVAIGSQAASWAASEFSEIPLVATMLLRADILAKHPAATGVQLEFPVESELEWLARMLPKRRIGALFDPAQNAERIRAAHRVAQRLGLELVSVEVASPRDLPDALEALSRRAQVLWGINDETVYTPATAKAILTFSYRNRIPLTGLSTPWVKAGALYALDRDYRDIGRQCGELAARVLRGERAASIPPETPRKLSYALNLKAARHMNLDLSSAVVQGAALRFD
jgi:putative ABC transport system substrate-binding protein